MSSIGRVEVVRHLPPAEGTMANTALQIRAWEGFQEGCSYVHAFAIDDPLAATLQVGQWVSFKKPRGKCIKEIRLVDVLTHHRLSSVACFNGEPPHEHIAAVRRLLDHYGVSAKTREEQHAQALAAHTKLDKLREWFNVKDYPTELVLSCFDPETVKRLRETL